MITEILTPNIEISWLPWAVAYFFFIGLSFSAVLLTLPAVLFGQKQLLGVAHVAMLVILTCAIVGPVALLGDLHQPGRFWHFYAHITPWSWMSIGSIFLPLYIVSTFVYSWLFLRPVLLQNKSKPGIAGLVGRTLGAGSWQGQQLLKPVALVVLLLAFSIALYTGSEVAIVASRALWNSYLIPVFFFITALLGACSLVLLIAHLIHADDHTLNSLTRYNRVFAFTSLTVVAGWFVLALTTTGAEANALMQFEGAYHWLQKSAVLLSLLLLSAILARQGSKLVLLSALAGLIVSWFARWLIFIDGQTIPKFGAGVYSYDFPLGADGLLGMLGIFGLWLFLAIALYELLPWKNKTDSNAQVLS